MPESWESAPIVSPARQPEPWESATIEVPKQRHWISRAGDALAKWGWATGPAGPALSLVAGALTRNVEQPKTQREAKGFFDAGMAGYQNSVMNLATTGRLPDVVLNPEHAKWYEKVASMAGQVSGDFPAMVLGGTAGLISGAPTGPGAAAVSGAGALAVPAAIRTALVQSYTKGEVTSTSDFLSRVSIVLKETNKNILSGAAMGYAGGRYTQAFMPAAETAMQKTGVHLGSATAEALTQPTVNAALEGRLPEPEEFLDAGVLIAGVRYARHVAGKLRTTYAKTGVTPAEVVADAKADPTIVRDLLAGAEPAPKLEAGVENAQVPSPNTGRSGSPTAEVVSPDAAAQGPGRAGSDASLQVVLGALNDASNRGISHLADGAVLGTVSDVAPTRGSEAVGARTGTQFVVDEFDTATPGQVDIRLTIEGKSEGSNVPHVVGTLRGNTFFIGTMDGGGIKGLGYDMYQALGEHLAENYPQAKWVVGFAGGTKDNPVGIKRLRNSFDGTQWSGDWAGTPVASLAAGPASRNPEVPRAYRDLATQQAVIEAVPGLAQEAAKETFGPVIPIPGEPTPTTINYNYIDTPDTVKGVLERVSDLNLEAIQKQRRGTVSWDQTQLEAGKVVAELLGSPGDLFTPREPGTPAGAAELLARKQILVGAAEDVVTKAKELRDLGTNASPEHQAAFLASVDRLAMIQAEFLGARAEAGRALNILKETRETAQRAKQIQKVLEQFNKSPEELAAMMAELDNPAAVTKMARVAQKATLWDMIVEGWKAAAVSGPITQVANVMGNTSFLAFRPAVDVVASTLGTLTGSKERVRAVEPLARVYGDLQGIMDGLKLAKIALMEDAPGGKAEHKQAIPGKAGHIVRTPFRALAAGDALFRSMAERGELYALASRQAVKEGFGVSTREFRERVAALVNEPPKEMAATAKEAGARFVFNAPLGAKGRAVQQFVKAWHLELAVPFIATPGNVFKEMARLTPAAPIVGEWREAIAAGGPEAHKALAEMALGTGLAALAGSLAIAGHVSGFGDPDPNKRRVQMASGWQPYSVKLGNTWYSYQRFQPLGTLLGLAADMAEVREHMEPGEQDQIPNILGAAFANSVTNQTFLQGFSQVVAAISHPERDMGKFLNSLAASTIPGALGQTAQVLDPYQREVQSMRDAIVNRIPLAKETLPVRRDIFGEPTPSQDRLGVVSPVGTKGQSTDKVRTEAARLGISVAPAPKYIRLPAAGTDLGRVDLTPEQRDAYAETSGKVAYEELAKIVDSPGYAGLSDLEKTEIFDLVFSKSREFGKAVALSEEHLRQETQRIVLELNQKLGE